MRQNAVPDELRGTGYSPFNWNLQKVLNDRGGNQGWLTFTNLVAKVQGLKSGPVHIGFGRHHPEGEFVLVPIPKEETQGQDLNASSVQTR
jgi:hypothetical protein